MLTTVNRILFVTMAFGAILAFGASPAHAEDAHADDATAQPATEPFLGDPYLLSTDPVSGEPLGDKPVIYQHEGRELRFTDEQSLDAFKADPDKFLPKVDEQMIRQQLPFYPLKTCMISGDELGGDMGQPVDLIYKNRLVRFCCDHCVKDFRKDPAKYINILNEAVIADQGPNYPVTTCMISGEKLGGDMGEPADVVIGNRLVRLCCEGCAKDLKENPLKHLKMIDDAAKEPSSHSEPAPSEPAAQSPDHNEHAGHQH